MTAKQKSPGQWNHGYQARIPQPSLVLVSQGQQPASVLEGCQGFCFIIYPLEIKDKVEALTKYLDSVKPEIAGVHTIYYL